MPKLPVLSWLEVVKALSKIGYQIDHQTGSHIIMRQKEQPHRRVTVPHHKEISRGTLRAIIREVGLEVNDFVKLL